MNVDKVKNRNRIFVPEDLLVSFPLLALVGLSWAPSTRKKKKKKKPVFCRREGPKCQMSVEPVQVQTSRGIVVQPHRYEGTLWHICLCLNPHWQVFL